MQTYSRQTKVNTNQAAARHLLAVKAACALAGALFLCASGFAQNETTAVSGISVEPPIPHAMSAASSPVVGSGFYELGAVFSLVPLHTQGEGALHRSTPPKLQEHTPDEISLAGTTDASAVISQLTAQDILTLDQAGALSEIEQHILLNSWHPSEAQGAGEILSLLLHDIASLKATHLDDVLPATYKDNTTKAALLRFKLNGQDILENIATIYISPAKEQRAFLLSLDLSSNADDTEQPDGIPTETLHLLFKSSGEFLHYKVAACTASKGDDAASFTKAFAAPSDMEAFRTGSIVSLKNTIEEGRVDLLIDLGDEAN